MSKKKHAQPNLPPATLLRLRLDGLWNNPALPSQTHEQIEADLDAAIRSVKLDHALPVLLAACHAAPPEAQAVLDAVLPGWLQRRDFLPRLEAAVMRQSLTTDLQALAVQWLNGAGLAVSVPEAAEMFHGAYDLDDGSQAAVIVTWYTTPRRNRLRGMSFLIDYNPPWDGALKDLIYYPEKTPEMFLESYVDLWARRGQAMTPIAAAEAKRKLLAALQCNRQHNIRLPKDLVVQRDPFLRHVLTLPDLPSTPPFTAADFDELVKIGQSPEALSHFEKTVGRRIRMEDGKEVFIDASLANAEMAWDDEARDE